jgi:hypothetical protein
MSNRETSDTSSQSGVSYPAGTAGASGNVKNVKISLDDQKTRLSKLGSSGAFNGHAVIIHADYSVWDSTSNKYLYPGVDYNVGDLQRT